MRADLRFHRDALTNEERDYTRWPAVDPESLSADDRKVFLARRGAIRAYVAGSGFGKINQKYGISAAWLWWLRVRVFSRHKDGRIYGERALVPYVRIKGYGRTKELRPQPAGAKGGQSGALGKLFEHFPELKEYVDGLFLKRKRPDTVHESRIRVKHIHKRFLDKCRALGIKNEYPFTTKWLGRSALRKYLVRLLHEQTERAVLARYGENAARKYRIQGHGAAEDVLRPYQRTQCDAHKIDAIFTIRISHPRLGWIPVLVPRIWIVVIIDVFSRAALSYHLVLGLECSARDVTRAIQRAVVPWRPRTFSIPALRYPERGGFPSGLYPALGWVAFDEFWIDNAKANLANITKDLLIEKMGAKVQAGALKIIERRAIMERLFLNLEQNGFQRLASTTGSHPRDTRRQDPEAAALKYDIRLEHLEDLLEVMFAQYNATPHSALGYRTPLEVIEQYLHTGGEVRQIDEADRTDAAFLYLRTVRTVRGDVKKSRKPYIEYEGAVYQHEVLARSPDLIGEKLTLHVNPDDLRLIKAFLPDGSDFGLLSAKAPWHRLPHSLETRTAINRLRHRKLVSFTEMDDPIAIYNDHLAAESLTNKRARPRFEKVRREKASAPSSLPEAETPAVPSSSATETVAAAEEAPRPTVVF